MTAGPGLELPGDEVILIMRDMRATAVLVIAILTLGFGHGLVLAQTQGGIGPALESIRMIDALTGWAVTHEQDANGLLRTTDGGSHWRDVTLHPFYLNATNVDVFSSLFAWVGALRTVDGGRTWTEVLAPGWVRSIDFINAREGWLLSCEGANNASAEVGVYRSTDGGDTWTRVAGDRAGSTENSFLQSVWGGEPHVTFLNAMTGWITRSDPVPVPGWSYLYATQDGGRTWKQQKLPLPPQLTSSWGSGTMPPKFFTARDGILPVFYANLNPQSYRPTASFAVLYMTHDSGTTWTYTTPVSGTNQTWGVDYYGRALWGMSFIDFNHGWMADGNVLYATYDGGRRWTALRPAPPFGDVKQLDFVSPEIGWAVRGTSPFLLKTLDGGRTWTPVIYAISRQ